ncbi:MAG: SRPBCC family protein [Pseudomonadota bacterium]
MRILKWIAGIIVVLAFIVVGGGFLMPREITLDRTVTIAAAPDEIFPHINNLSANAAWSPWLGLDPNVVLDYGDIAEGVGATMRWASENQNVGTGSMEIVVSEPGKRIETALDFGPMGGGTAAFDLVETSAGTDVTWGFYTDLGMNPIARWFGPMIEGPVGDDYERGLNNLKSLVEG